MQFIIEAAPEILFSLIVVALFVVLAKDKVSARTMRGVLFVYGGGLLFTVVLLYQSSTQPVNTLQVQESDAATNTELTEVKDLSPKPLSSKESSERLKTLIENQKDSVSLEENESKN